MNTQQAKQRFGIIGNDLQLNRDIDIASRRRLMCDYHNIVKLVSRARKLAKYKLDCPDNPRWDWFPYDATSEEWTLMRPRGVLH